MYVTDYQIPRLQDVALSLPSLIAPDRPLDAIWPQWEKTLRQLSDLDIAVHLASFRPELASLAEQFANVQHIALYVGEHSSLTQVDCLDVWFQQARSAGTLRSYDMGPSHIAPRCYSTQGWWFAISLPDGTEAELFTCLSRKEWMKRPAFERAALMSHVALTLRPGIHLDDWAAMLRHTNCECIHSSTVDVLGHTYAHWFDPDRQLILEVLEHAQTHAA